MSKRIFKKDINEKIFNIFREAKSCRRCYGDTSLHIPLPDEKNGGLGAKIIFILERPGRVGTSKSDRISFDNEDPTAKFFKKLFSEININRKNIFITNAVLCHPMIENYRDTPVSSKELTNCLYFLEKQIKIIKPKLIITLGIKSLQSVKYLYPHRTTLKRFKLKKNIGEVVDDELPFIYPLYHTSLRAQITRSDNQQRKDWSKISNIINKLI